MPELPEVETTRRGITPHLLNKTVTGVTIRQRKLRWPIPRTLDKQLPGQMIQSVQRRAKYILITTDAGTLILHLGMSGSLRILSHDTPAGKHDHVDIQLDDGRCLRLTDPRRFGAVLWTTQDPNAHELITHLGPEPLSEEFNTDYLFNKSRGRKVAIKQFIMDGKVVVGVGNIYANESLFMAGIHPHRPAGKVSKARYEKLVDSIKKVLSASIKMGGTTLRDFVGGDGKPGYFKQTLRVYDRTGETCHSCKTAIKEMRTGQRSTFYCPTCQR